MERNIEDESKKADKDINNSIPAQDAGDVDDIGEVDNDVDVADEPEGIVLKVKGDPKDISPDERKRKVKSLAGAITHGVRKNGEVTVRAFGPIAVYKAVKALAIARGLVATQGFDLYCAPAYADAIMGGQKKTGIKFMCFISKNEG